MICAADSGGSASRTIQPSTSMSQTNRGILISVIPGQRIETMVAMTLIALLMLLTPESRIDSAQKSVALPGENALAVRGAYANHPTSGAEEPGTFESPMR